MLSIPMGEAEDARDKLNRSGESRSKGPDPDLNYPDESWTGFLRNHFGPSIAWALLGIGGSHIVLGPTFSATFGYIAIAAIVLVYLIKYGCWELGIRYNYAVGENMFRAYSELPGPRLWAVWLAGIDLSIKVAFNAGAIGLSAATFLGLFTDLGLSAIFAILMAISGSIVIIAQYDWLERFLMSLAAILAIAVVVSAVAGIPSIETFTQTAFNLGQLSTPAFIALFVSVAGLAPTALSTSWVLGSWSMTKNEGAKQLKEYDLDPDNERYHDYIASWLRVGIRDFRMGYLFSLIVMIAITSLAATVFYPTPPTNQNLAYQMGQILGGSIGAWSFYIIIAGAFAALWSTVIGSIDGNTRALLDVLQVLVEKTELSNILGEDMKTERKRRIAVAIFVVVSSIPILLLGQRPVTLVTVFGVFLALVESFIYPANLYIVRENLPKRFLPSRTKLLYYFGTIALVLIISALTVASNLGFVS